MDWQYLVEKWKSRIICVLSAAEKLRYSELRREMCNITDAVLAATLKDLIEVGIVERKSYDEIPPSRVYVDTKRKICCAYFAEYLPMVRCFL